MIKTQVLYAILIFLLGGGLLIAVVSLLQRKLHKEVYFAYAMEFFNVGLVAIPTYFSGSFLLMALLVLGGRCSYEMSVVARNHYFVVYSNMLLTVVGIFTVYYQTYLVFCVMASVMVIVNVVFVVFKKHSVFSCLLTTVYPCLFFYCFAIIALSDNGFIYCIFLYAIVEINDAVAYLFGKAFGKHKLCPSISPNKTYEGSIAGVFAAIAAGFYLAFIFIDLSSQQVCVLVVTVCISGVIGDLVGSKIKRIYKVKDFSDIIPGQGGVLDMLDALIFSAPAFCGFAYSYGMNFIR